MRVNTKEESRKDVKLGSTFFINGSHKRQWKICENYAFILSNIDLFLDRKRP